MSDVGRQRMCWKGKKGRELLRWHSLAISSVSECPTARTCLVRPRIVVSSDPADVFRRVARLRWERQNSVAIRLRQRDLLLARVGRQSRKIITWRAKTMNPDTITDDQVGCVVDACGTNDCPGTRCSVREPATATAWRWVTWVWRWTSNAICSSVTRESREGI